jgi:prepilin-type N-terminal cleavage/methylation domain-containing protein
MSQEINARQNGFSLVEILIATMVLTVGLLAMASSTAYVSAQLKSTSYETQRTQAKERIVEQLRATPYTSVTTRTTALSVGRYSMTWNVTTNSLNKTVALYTSGPAYRGRSRGARVTVVDTMVFSIVSP